MSSQRWYHAPCGFALSVVSGVLLAFALPPRDINILGWVAMMPLLAGSLLVKRTLIAAAFGIITSVVCAWVLIGYLATPQEFGNLVGAFGSLALVFAWTAGLACFACKRCKPTLWPLFVACAAVTGELLSRYVFPVNIAITQHQTPGALRLASITGVWGVSFLLWFVPALVLMYFVNRKSIGNRVFIAPVVILVMLMVPVPHINSGETSIKVAAVQAPGPWDAADVMRNLPADVKVVVWPEHLMGVNDTLPNRSAREHGVYIVSSHVEKAGPKEKYNTAKLIAPSGRTIDSVRKRHLFGKEIAGFKSGYDNHAIQCGDIKVGVPICFDTEYTDICRSLVREGAQILLVPNNDPEMHNMLFNYLHVAIIPFRAAENGVPVVWAESYGLSSVVNSSGYNMVQAGEKKITAVSTDVPLRQGRTLYLLLGDYFAYASTIVTVAGIIVMLKARRGKDQELFQPGFVL